MSYKPDIGTVISLNTGVVITGATCTIEVKKPSGPAVSWSGAVGADTFSVEHTIVSGDLTESGIYVLQAKVILGGSTWYGQSVDFEVKPLFGK